MNHPKILGVRLTDPERERVRELARRAGRTESDFVRLLLRSVGPESISSGIKPPRLPETETYERGMAMA